MKKIVFLLILCLLLTAGVAYAALPCDKCGSPDTALSGSGAWCHWVCAECGYTSARNHDPHSYNTGLVPASCTGYCRWCGATAVESSHQYGPWISNDDATCTADGTETTRCQNGQCGRASTRTVPGSALGHDYKESYVPPTCEYTGANRHTCTRCGDKYNSAVFPALGHDVSRWVYNGDGTHRLTCSRPGCTLGETSPCTPVTLTAAGQEMTLCTVCGQVISGGSSMAVSTSAQALLDATELPGELLVLVDAAPFGTPQHKDAFYLFVTDLIAEGKSVPFSGRMEIVIDLNEHPFQVEGSIFSGLAPDELNARAVKLVRVESETREGQAVQVWHETPFTLKKGVLTAEVEQMGMYLLVLVIAEPEPGA